MNGFNLSDITDAKLGTTTLGSIYLGSTKLWPLSNIDYSKEYLTIKSLADNNTITWTFTGSDPIQNVIYWSKNGTSWTSAIASTSDTPVSLATLNKGEKMYLKGENVTYASSTSRYSHFNSDYEFNVSGNIMSLIYGDNFIGQTTLPSSSYIFYGIFSNSKVVDASNLILPVTTLTNYCYRNMFKGCTSLTTAPELPATTLASSCYSNMFRGCTSLTAAPELPATTLTGTYCYYYMFQGCTSITAAPELPATTLTNYCYSYMFNGCTSLATAPVLPATTLANYCYYHMFEGCSSLTTATELPATTLANGCYSYMFYGCTSLGTAPILPATTLTSYCYAYMFEGCSSLTTAAQELPATTLATGCYMSMFAATKITSAPELPATILADSCYRNMFYGCASLIYPPTLNATILQPRCYQHMFFGCTSLKTAPELPATTLTNYCYAYMFQNCTSLSYIKCLATNISASNSHDWWLYNVASTGTFTKKAPMTSWPSGAHGIPSGWRVVNV